LDWLDSQLPQSVVYVSFDNVTTPSDKQTAELPHNSTGCFVTHCGWNSTIEALSLGVPMVGGPQFADQPTNAKFVEDMWKVGVRLKKLDDGDDREELGIMRKEAIEKGITEVIEGDRTKCIRRNAEKWKSLARATVAEGGTSANNIQEFVAQLTNSQLLQGTRQSGV
ncbi:UDP-glycosyltransferase 74E1, partial [Linum grandiflorum]